ncbi:MAG: KEOPS complex subunit Cgi121 [Candidatus Micrarchaeia archaeon]
MERELRKILKLIQKANKAKIIEKEVSEEEIQRMLKKKNLQLFNARVKDEEIKLAYASALIAFFEKTNIAKSLKNEIIARVAKERNVSEAISKFGAKPGKVKLLILDKS